MLQTLSYEDQLKAKMESVRTLFDEACLPLTFNEMIHSPEHFEYRNKM